MTKRVFNFSAGPAVLPEKVLLEAQEELYNYKGRGMSVMEMSHRSADFDEIFESAENGVREVLGVPDDYAVMFLQGGASLQFAMVPTNLYLEAKPVDMIHTGVWTKKAIAELKKIAEFRFAGSSEEEKFIRVPGSSELSLSKDASYVHIASNNTIYGTQFPEFPGTGDIPLVADMSSDIFSRRIDVSRFGLIFAGAQKNIGPSGVTLVVMRKSLAERCDENVATMLQYRTHIKGGSRFNTPPTFGIYIISLVMKWLRSEGGLAAMEKTNNEKAEKLYAALDADDFYDAFVEKSSRSRMNVVFRIDGGNEELEAMFVRDAATNGLVGLKGHRSAGGLRASIYNAHPVEGVDALCEFLKDFKQKRG